MIVFPFASQHSAKDSALVQSCECSEVQCLVERLLI